MTYETKRIQIKHGYLDYDIEEEVIYFLDIFVEPEYRKQGKAKKLLQKFFSATKGRRVWLGGFTKLGVHLINTIKELAKKYKVKLLDIKNPTVFND